MIRPDIAPVGPDEAKGDIVPGARPGQQADLPQVVLPGHGDRIGTDLDPNRAHRPSDVPPVRPGPDLLVFPTGSGDTLVRGVTGLFSFPTGPDPDTEPVTTPPAAPGGTPSEQAPLTAEGRSFVLTFEDGEIVAVTETTPGTTPPPAAVRDGQAPSDTSAATSPGNPVLAWLSTFLTTTPLAVSDVTCADGSRCVRVQFSDLTTVGIYDERNRKVGGDPAAPATLNPWHTAGPGKVADELGRVVGPLRWLIPGLHPDDGRRFGF